MHPSALRSLTLASACFAAAILVAGRASAGDFSIDAAMPGGNIVVERTVGNDVYLHQDVRDTAGWWFYWYFRVRGAEGRTLSFHFTRGNVIGAFGPSISTDSGATWKWLGSDAVKGDHFIYAFPADAKEVRFSMTLPYVESDWQKFLARHKDSSDLRPGVLCKSKKGRSIELLYTGRLDGKPARHVVVTARHHSCESIASYELEGIVDQILAPDDTGRWLRANVAFLIVPFMDKDGVEDGDPGKNRKPYDTNRDYDNPRPIYPQVAAMKKLLPAWSAGHLDIGLDLHCPGLRGPTDEYIYFVHGPDNFEVAERVNRFSDLLEQATRDGPLSFRTIDNMQFGSGWNNLREPKNIALWEESLPGTGFAAPLECPYASVHGQMVTCESARALGRALAHSIDRYLAVSTTPAHRTRQ